MRLDINLASHPYEDAGDFYRRWGTALAAVLLVSLGLIGVAIHEWMSTRSISKEIAAIHRQSDNLETKKTQELAVLNRPENRGTRDRSAFVNQLIAIKSFSWTEVMADMETLMPTRIHIVSIQPELDKEGRIEVKITAASDSREKGVELLQNLEKSRYFRNAVLRDIQVNNQPQQGGDIAKFGLVADYVVPQVHVPEKGKTPHGNKPTLGASPSRRPHPIVAGNRPNAGE